MLEKCLHYINMLGSVNDPLTNGLLEVEYDNGWIVPHRAVKELK